MSTETSAVLREREEHHASGVYALKKISITRGEGARVWDAEGNSYIDCAAGHGVANLGHAHPRVAEAIAEQARTLVTCAGSFPNDQRAALLEKLAVLFPTGFERFFLCNSGTEAVEGALKFARLSTGRSRIVAAMRGFHGRTLGALSASWEKRYREPFEPLIPGVRHARFDDLNSFDEAIDNETACVIVEIVQGEGGVRFASNSFLRGLRRLCDERGALLIFDEVQTGFGRTGRTFAFEHHGVAPDLVTLGKAIAGGVPMGAVAIGPALGELGLGTHGSTFGGNPLACAAASAVLDVLRGDRLAARAASYGQGFLDQLCAIESPLIREVRGLGLMVAVELRSRVAPVLRALEERGILALAAGPSVLRFLPPLVISQADLAVVARELESILNAACPAEAVR